MSEASHIVCPHCGGVNRIAAGKPSLEAKCGVCHKPLFTGHPVGVDAAAFDKHIARSDVPVVVDFWAAWCGPCRAMAPVFEQVASEVEPAYRFLKVDTDREAELAARYAIRSIPTLMIFRNGKPVARRAGAVNAAMLHTWLKEGGAVAA